MIKKLLLTVPCALALGVPIFNSAQATPTENPNGAHCSFSAEDTRWTEEAIAAWHHVNKTISQVSHIPPFDILFFDDVCQSLSPDALATEGKATWHSKPHGGMVTFPDGDKMPPMVNSFTMSSEINGQTFFVMSTPSVWRSGGVKSAMGLTMLMTPVMLHEAMHAIQSPTYGKQIEALSKKYDLPDDFNDDSVQKLFKENPDFTASVLAEIDLLLKAAHAPTDTEAHALARAAQNKIQARYDTWFTGDAEKYRAIDDIWLTMEGSGQWVGYKWLSDPQGGGLTKETALKEFGQRGKWWSQNLGFALFMAIDRLSDDWKKDAFGSGERTVLTLLDEALEG